MKIKQFVGRGAIAGVAVFALLVVLLAASQAYAQEENVYRQFLGIDSRKLVWFIAQMHLFFAAFVLGVPLFAMTIEIVGWKTGDPKYDKLAYEFTSLLSVAYATTAALGGLLAFTLITLYPTFWTFMTGVFKDIMFIYALLFFAETFLLYLYYYGWDMMKGGEPFNKTTQLLFKALGAVFIVLGLMTAFGYFDPETGMRTDMRVFIVVLYLLPIGGCLLFLRDLKTSHIVIGVLLNIVGTLLMQLANSWAGFMMSPANPVGVSLVNDAGEFIGTTWQAFENVLATPIVIHRILGNLAFGGLVAGSYAAVKFLGAKTAEDKAHYDWMGYVANMVAVSALIPIPFAGYYLGREVYSTSAVMGNNMMGGDFSWTFIIQAMLVGSLFIISSYYLWSGMTRIPGAERYFHFIKWILFVLIVSFAVWLTPHNLPLTAMEVGEMGGSQYHPMLKFLGLMPAKNAVINLIILSLFFSFVLYRRGNKVMPVSIKAQGKLPKIVITGAALLAIFVLVGQYGAAMYNFDIVAELDLPADRDWATKGIAYSLILNCIFVVIVTVMALNDRGKAGQYLYLAYTALSVAVFLGVWGFVVMENASPVLRNVAVAQFLQLLSCLLVVTAIDLFLWRGAQEVGPLKWGKMTVRSQYALLLLTIVITMNMGLMGFIRSGLRGDWHVFGIMRDTSEWGFTPTNFTMTQQVGGAVFLFLVSCAFMFWLGSIVTGAREKKTDTAGTSQGGPAE